MAATRFSNSNTSSATSLDIEKETNNNFTLEDGLKLTDPTQAPQSTALSLSRSRKFAISTTLILCNSLLFMSFGSTLGGGFAIGKSFDVFSPTNAAWIAASYPLTQGAFVLVSGRIGDVYGHKLILLLGGAWWILWSLITGFCTTSLISFVIARAMSGIGAAMVMPNVVAGIGKTFRPGETGRNLSFGFLGFGAPVGGTVGIAVLAVFMQFFGHWRWFFFFLAGVGLLLFATVWLVLPKEVAEDRSGSVDWFGAVLGIGALVIFNVAWNQAPAVGWSALSEITLLFVAIGFFVLFGIWEHKFAKSPIMPLDIWTAPSFLPLMLVVLFSVMAYGIAIWYMVAWQQLVRHWSVLEFTAGLSPHAVAGSLAAPFAAWLVPRMAAQWIVAFGAMTVLLSCILLATMPEQQTYWAQVFPATILMSLCPDFNYTAAQIIATNSVRKSEQGVAGSLIWLLQLYGASIGLGFAGTVEANSYNGGKEVLRGYRGALYLAAGLAVAALIIDVLFVRVPKDNTQDWVEERVVTEKAAGDGRDRITVQCGDAL